MWLWQLNLNTLTYGSVIKLQVLTCTRFLLVFLLHFLLCGKERSLTQGFAMWYRHSVPVWYNLPVRQWQDYPITGCPPTASSQSDCAAGAKRHHCRALFCLLTAIDNWDELRLLTGCLIPAWWKCLCWAATRKGGCKDQVDVTLIYMSISPFDVSFCRCLPLRIWELCHASNTLWSLRQLSEKGETFSNEWFQNILMQIHILICWRIYLNAASGFYAT